MKTTTCHLKQLNRYKNVTVLNQLMGSQSPLIRMNHFYFFIVGFIYIQFIAETFLPGTIIITLYQVVEQVVNKIVCDSLLRYLYWSLVYMSYEMHNHLCHAS
jgi:hypothetical protein